MPVVYADCEEFPLLLGLRQLYRDPGERRALVLPVFHRLVAELALFDVPVHAVDVARAAFLMTTTKDSDGQCTLLFTRDPGRVPSILIELAEKIDRVVLALVAHAVQQSD